ncbi:MAG: RNA polymerase sigma factor [Phycisphaerae bacterium]
MNSRNRSDADERRAEKRLVSRARRGDSDAMRELIDLHKDRLFAFVRRMIRNPHDAEEIVQDALLKAFVSLDSFKTEYRYSTWLFTIAYRLCLNALRKKQALTGEVDFGMIAHADPGAGYVVAQSDAARHLKTVVWRAVERLSPPQRATVLMFYQHGQGCQDIAQVLELPVATVKSHLHRARARLRELLEPVVEYDSANLRILEGLAG